MHINITGRHFKLTPTIKDYVEKELDKLKRYFERIIECNVILERDNEGDRAQITLKVSGHSFHGEVVSSDMVKSIDQALEKIEKQLRRYKDKITR